MGNPPAKCSKAEGKPFSHHTETKLAELQATAVGLTTGTTFPA